MVSIEYNGEEIELNDSYSTFEECFRYALKEGIKTINGRERCYKYIGNNTHRYNEDRSTTYLVNLITKVQNMEEEK